MSSYKHLKIHVNGNSETVTRWQSDNVIRREEAEQVNYSVKDTINIVVHHSRNIFKNSYIVDRVGYSRQTISEIHNGKYTYAQAIKYIEVMSELLIKLGFKRNVLIVL